MLNRIIDYIYPPSCILCGAHSDLSQDLCATCNSDLKVNRSACRLCALPLPVAHQESLVCGECLQSIPLQHQSWSAFVYAQPLEWLIQQLKFNRKQAYAQLLGQLSVPLLPELEREPDCIIPVPLHPRRLRSRGYNQAFELVKPIARHLQIPVDTASCQRIKHTTAQSDLDAGQRKKNIRNAFHFENTQNYNYVILFDDVVTTGSTIAELVRTVKKQGVSRVDVWSLARVGK